jgi:hypothetical protein
LRVAAGRLSLVVREVGDAGRVREVLCRVANPDRHAVGDDGRTEDEVLAAADVLELLLVEHEVPELASRAAECGHRGAVRDCGVHVVDEPPQRERLSDIETQKCGGTQELGLHDPARHKDRARGGQGDNGLPLLEGRLNPVTVVRGVVGVVAVVLRRPERRVAHVALGKYVEPKANAELQVLLGPLHAPLLVWSQSQPGALLHEPAADARHESRRHLCNDRRGVELPEPLEESVHHRPEESGVEGNALLAEPRRPVPPHALVKVDSVVVADVCMHGNCCVCEHAAHTPRQVDNAPALRRKVILPGESNQGHIGYVERSAMRLCASEKAVDDDRLSSLRLLAQLERKRGCIGTGPDRDSRKQEPRAGLKL